MQRAEEETMLISRAGNSPGLIPCSSGQAMHAWELSAIPLSCSPRLPGEES